MLEILELLGGVIFIPIGVLLLFEKSGQRVIDRLSNVFHVQTELYDLKHKIVGVLIALLGFISLFAFLYSLP